jgi:hypothetical protein
MVLKEPSRVTRFPGVASQTVVCRPICDGWTAIDWPPGMPADESIPHAMAGHLDADTWVSVKHLSANTGETVGLHTIGAQGFTEWILAVVNIVTVPPGSVLRGPPISKRPRP